MIHIQFGGPAWQRHYDPENLSDTDQVRLSAPRAPRAEKDWQVSRSIAAELRRATGADRHAPLALSHSRGHALAAIAPASVVLAVDLERCRPRDTEAIARWVCTPEERAALLSEIDPARRLEDFYVLWTLKESLLKAARLPFPAGMTQVGLTYTGASAAVLRVPEGQWQARVYRLPEDWVAAVAWQMDLDARETVTDAVQTDGVHWLQPALPGLLGHWRTPPRPLISSSESR